MSVDSFRPHPVRHRLVLATASLAIAVALVGSACATDSDPEAVSQSSDTSGTSSSITSAPSVRPDDAAGGEDPPECAYGPGCAVVEQGNFVEEPGYIGPGFVSDPSVPLVDEQRITTVEQGEWAAMGLVTNGERPDASLVVVATLFDRSGSPLEIVEAPALVAPLRPGEPAPFRIQAAVEVDVVHDVEWTAIEHTYDSDSSAADARALGLAVFWSRAFGEGDPVEVPGHRDDPGEPLAHLVYGTATNLSSTTLVEPSVVAAWLGSDGRVVALAQTPLLRAGSGEPLDGLDPGAAADLVVVVDDPDVGPLLNVVDPILWGMSR